MGLSVSLLPLFDMGVTYVLLLAIIASSMEVAWGRERGILTWGLRGACLNAGIVMTTQAVIYCNERLRNTSLFHDGTWRWAWELVILLGGGGMFAIGFASGTALWFVKERNLSAGTTTPKRERSS